MCHLWEPSDLTSKTLWWERAVCALQEMQKWLEGITYMISQRVKYSAGILLQIFRVERNLGKWGRWVTDEGWSWWYRLRVKGPLGPYSFSRYLLSTCLRGQTKVPVLSPHLYFSYCQLSFCCFQLEYFLYSQLYKLPFITRFFDLGTIAVLWIEEEYLCHNFTFSRDFEHN